MILKPFMLRRIKKDVENELSDKVKERSLLSVCWKSKRASFLTVNAPFASALSDGGAGRRP